VPPKSSSPWPWIIGGCLLIVILILVAVVGLGWWGIREAKKEINNRINNNSILNEIEESADKFSKESEEWEKKSQDFRESMPDPEEFQKEMEKNIPVK
jgi:Tfp pilus assembly protein PilO